MMGVEPTRVAPADFESAASAIPPHPRAKVIIHYFPENVKFFFEIENQDILYSFDIQ